MAYQTRGEHLQGKRVVIRGTSNKYAEGSIGKTGVVNGYAPLGMVIVVLDETHTEYWADTFNVSVC